jgi:phosphoenolpyruvate-protein phosphotransferase
MSEKVLPGIAASEGIAIGPAFNYAPSSLTIQARKAATAEEEFARFEEAVKQARAELRYIYSAVLERTHSEKHAAIFEAHVMMLEDPALAEAVRTRVSEGAIVEQAVVEATREMADMLAGMDEELFAARATDVRDVGRRVLRILLGVSNTALETLAAPSIIVAHDLTPSDTAGLDPDLTRGFCTAAGGLTSHTTILARTLGIPAVVGIGQALQGEVRSGAMLILDGLEGKIIVDPEPSTLRRYEQVQEEWQEWMARMKVTADLKARTASGRLVEVGANVGDAQSAAQAMAYGAEGIGLLRTEFLYLEASQPPGEAEQIEAYKEIFATAGQRPVIVRTLDIGGDKPPMFLDFGNELNPFLGWRAIRISLDNEPLFRTQLRAILQAAVGYNVLIMYPMISSLEELQRANAILGEVREELAVDGIEHAQDIPVGIMVETPAAAVMADALAPLSDFFSIGTNDLTQYTLAVDRTNERVASLFHPLHPALLRLVKQTIDAAHAHGIWVGMCGELAGMQKAIPILLGLGLDEFSMVPRAIPHAKWLIRQITDEEARLIAKDALSKGTAAEIEKLMQDYLEGIHSDEEAIREGQ